MKVWPLLFVLPVSVCIAQSPVITAFEQSGRLTWTGSRSNGYYAVEWASSPTGSWFRTWSHLQAMPASGGQQSAMVPVYYRVVWHDNPPTATVSAELLGTSTSGQQSYSGTLGRTPVVSGTPIITVAGFTWTDSDGNGSLTGGSGVTGSIDYQTGAWIIDLEGNYVDDDENITATYTYVTNGSSPPYPLTVTDELLATTTAGQQNYSGRLNRAPVQTATIIISVAGFTFTDSDGDGNLTGGSGVTGRINYQTGAWSIDLQGNFVDDDECITATYTIHHGQQSPPPLPPPDSVAVSNELLRTTTAGQQTYAGSLVLRPVEPTSITITVDGFTFTDSDGDGNLTGGSGVTGSINYQTGAWSIDLEGNYVGTGETISASYKALSPAEVQVTDKLVALGVTGRTIHSGTIDNTPLVRGSVVITAGTFMLTDSGTGTLAGNLGTTGTVNYTTGAWTINLNGYEVAAGTPILARYKVHALW